MGVRAKAAEEFAARGVTLNSFYVESISPTEETAKAIDARASMGAIGNMQAYMQYQGAQAMREAAQNEGGAGAGASLGFGVGAGAAMGQMLGQAAQQPQQAAGGAAPPPLPQAAAFHVAIGGQQAGPYDMATLQQYVQSGQITRDTLVWKNGMAQWTKAGDVADLANLFGAAPPPLPPK